ncbi:hypothetical protein B0H16DRAFT_1476973 [Mycena metata]|uniref:Uncharacterized protein n=1 Tax=Mycena metata TaxID=1033252 RepID=A0AAD7MGN1_9AGAR|nr:hypothetical protein B0H16DRAFT_1476973 [Mycena metata]
MLMTLCIEAPVSERFSLGNWAPLIALLILAPVAALLVRFGRPLLPTINGVCHWATIQSLPPLSRAATLTEFRNYCTHFWLYAFYPDERKLTARRNPRPPFLCDCITVHEEYWWLDRLEGFLNVKHLIHEVLVFVGQPDLPRQVLPLPPVYHVTTLAIYLRLCAILCHCPYLASLKSCLFLKPLATTLKPQCSNPSKSTPPTKKLSPAPMGSLARNHLRIVCKCPPPADRVYTNYSRLVSSARTTAPGFHPPNQKNSTSMLLTFPFALRVTRFNLKPDTLQQEPPLRQNPKLEPKRRYLSQNAGANSTAAMYENWWHASILLDVYFNCNTILTSQALADATVAFREKWWHVQAHLGSFAQNYCLSQTHTRHSSYLPAHVRTGGLSAVFPPTVVAAQKIDELLAADGVADAGQETSEDEG